MTNKELKNMISKAYEVKPSAESRAFISKYQKSDMKMWDIVRQQAAGIGLLNIAAGLTVLFIFWQVLLQCGEEDVLSFVRLSAIVPPIAAIAISGTGRSEKYGMDELEMATRFSLRTVLAARLIAIGIIDSVIFAMLIIAFGQMTNLGTLQAMMVVLVPYIVTAWGCLVITRKIHSNRDIALCLGFAGIVSILCSITDSSTPWIYLFTESSVSYLMCVVMFVMLGLEIRKLLKGENSKWNLC